MFPKLSAPLIKDIRTGEGVAEWAVGAAVGALTACSDLSVAKGATYLTILAGLKGVRRGLVKIVALQQGAGIGAPLAPPQVLTTVLDETEKAATGALAPPAVDPGTTDAPVVSTPKAGAA